MSTVTALFTITVAIYLLLAVIGDVNAGPCDKEVDSCMAKQKCRRILRNLLDKRCKELFSGKNLFSSEPSEKACTRSCRKALKRAKRGSLNRLLNCRSDSTDYFPYQNRARHCLTGKTTSKPQNNYIRNGCSSVFKRCTANSLCRRKYEEMMYKCDEMLLGAECSNSCEVALRPFLMANQTAGFFHCKCDGDLYFQKTCYSLKQNIKKLCVSDNFKVFLKSNHVVSAYSH